MLTAVNHFAGRVHDGSNLAIGRGEIGAIVPRCDQHIAQREAGRALIGNLGDTGGDFDTCFQFAHDNSPG